MNTNKKIVLTVATCALFSLFVIMGFMYTLSKPRILADHELRNYGAMLLETPRRFSEFNLIDHSNKPFTKASLQDKWTLIFFGFTQCPDICPTTMATLAKVYGQLNESDKQKTQVVLLSVDPENDTPAKLAQYVPYFHKDFIGVTGNSYEILSLATQLGIVFTKVQTDDGYTVDHSSYVVIINPKGDYHGFFRPPFEEGSVRVALRSMQHTFQN